MFLIAGYARYNCPYVWIRSNHHRLIKLMGDVESEKDSPLRLKSTNSWKDRSKCSSVFRLIVHAILNDCRYMYNLRNLRMIFN